MHIAVFFQYYHNPDCPLTGRHFAFIKQWARHHTVTLITTREWYDRRITHDFPWVPDNVELHMLNVPYDNAMGTAGRLNAFVRYFAGAVRLGLSIPRPDVILGTSTPLTAAWAAAHVARRRGIPWVFEVRDLWPDFPVQMGAVRSKWMSRALYGLENQLYRQAAHIVPLSPDMACHVLKKAIPSERVTTLLNGTDFPLIDAASGPALDHIRQEYGLQDKRVVLYAGAFGRANAIPTLLEAAKALADRNDIHFVFSGHGFHQKAVTEAARRGDNILVLPPQPRHRMLSWFRIADLTLVPFIDLPVLESNSPAKFFDSLGAGTPVIVTNSGWTRRFVELHNVGWYVPPENASALAKTIVHVFGHPDTLREMGDRGNRIARSLFDRRTLATRMERIFLDVIAQRQADSVTRSH